MTSTTTNYNLILYNDTTDKLLLPADFFQDVAGDVVSNMMKIDTQMKVNADGVANKLSTTDPIMEGNLLFTTDGGNDIGDVSTNRPSSLYSGSVISDNLVETTTFNKVTVTPSNAVLTIADSKTLSVPASGVASATFVAGAGTAVNSGSMFGGYTLAQIVKALVDAGILV